jgi:hypothetical protein
MGALQGSLHSCFLFLGLGKSSESAPREGNALRSLLDPVVGVVACLVSHAGIHERSVWDVRRQRTYQRAFVK